MRQKEEKEKHRTKETRGTVKLANICATRV